MHTMSLLFNQQGQLTASTHSIDQSVVNVDEIVLFYRGQTTPIAFADLMPILTKQFRIDVDIVFRGQKYAGNVTRVTKVDGESEYIVSLKHSTDNSAAPTDKMINILDSAQIASWEWNVCSDELHVNERWANILGYTLADIVPVTYDTWLSHLHPDYRPLLEQKLLAHYRGKESYFEFESPVLTHDGEWVWVKDIGRVVSRTDDGEPEWVFGARIDIHRSKMAQLELEKLQQQLDHVMELSPSVIYKMSADHNEEIRFITKGVESLLGYSPNEVIGGQHWWTSRIRHEDVKEYRRCAQSTKLRAYHPIMDCEYRFTKGNGEEVWLVDRLRYVENGDGGESYFVGSVIDLSEFVTLNQHFKTLSLLPPGIIYQFEQDAEGHMSFPYVSQEFEHIFGVSPEEAQQDAKHVFAVLHPDDESVIKKLIEQSSIEMSEMESEFRIERDGETHWYFFQAAPAKQVDGAILWSGQIIDITERKQMVLKLEKESTTDPLTGTYNRRFFMDQIKLLRELTPDHPHEFSILALDFDHFKTINDTYGHDVGDAVLKQTVHAVQPLLREPDILARMGGEEFDILLPNTSATDAMLVAERIRDTVEQNQIRHGETHLNITLTIGVVSSLQATNIPELLKLADRALYRGKEQGRNRVILASD